jgi:opacity protein-like surface antigen
MRWLAVPLAFGFVHAADAGELEVDYLRGSAGPKRSYVVIQAPVQADPLRGPVSNYTPQPRPPERTVAMAPVPGSYGWTGFYAGVTAGLAAGSYGNQTSTQGGGYMNAAQAVAVTAAGDQTIPAHGFATGIETGYNWQVGQFLFGGEADLQAIHLNAAANSGAVAYPGAPGAQFVVSSYGNSNWLLTARARAGLITSNNALFFVTGGLALTQLDSNFLFTDNLGVLESARLNALKTGFAVSGGVEAPLADRLSLKVEYQYVNFGSSAATGTGNNLTPFFPNQVFAHSGNLTANIGRVGLNYHFTDGNVWPGAATPSSNFKPLPLNWPDWEVEAGARTWFSSGRIGAPQPLENSPGSTLASRLTFTGLNAASGEVFARADQAGGFFLKGFLGAGGTGSGKLNDEDFPAAGAYSNTLSSATGHIAYATIDAGYTFLKTAAAKLGAFVGYNYYEEDVNTYNCTQLAGAATCVAANPFPANFLGISQDGHYKSLRLGLSSQFMLTDRLRVTADVAYLPLTNFTGLDSHNARELLLPQTSSSGDGVMLETILDYGITDAWNVGVGGRYWTWNTRTGTTTFNFLGAPPPIVEPSRYNSERYGMFVQSSYQWGGAAPAARTYVAAAAPMNWTGFYVGGHVGGGWGDDHWSDPFGSAPSGLGAVNVAGFGDTTRATGPLIGGQVGFDWQKNNMVFGVQADASAADMVGESTCFSGLGGVNCQRAINALGTLTGRVGYAWGRSLGYVKAGGAMIAASYGLNGNTNAVTLGTGSSSGTAMGWTAGGGLEYGLTDCWSTMVEYDYIGVSSTSVSFPTVAVIGANNTAIQQAINVVKLGVNYRFNTGHTDVVVAKY